MTIAVDNVPLTIGYYFAGFVDGEGSFTVNGIKEILQIRKDMNDGGVGKRKFSDTTILQSF